MPTPVIITAQISDPTLIPNSVNLLRLGASGTQPIVLGVMHDDGQNGDAVAGDQIYTLQTTFNEHAAGQIQLEVSAAFRGRLQRVTRSLQPIQLSQPQTFIGTSTGITLNYPADWVIVQQTAHSTSFSNVQQPMPVNWDTDPDSSGESFFQVLYGPQANPSGLPISQWFAQLSPHLPSAPDSTSSISVAGDPAIYSQITEIGEYAVIYISRGNDVIELSYKLSAPQFIGEYQAIVNSITFTR